MSVIDSEGRTLPDIEAPSADKLRVYGDLVFLAFRSARHRKMTLGELRTYFEPAVELGQFRIFRFDDVPRGVFTWAFMSPVAERKLVTGVPLEPADWRSGDRLWIIDLIAPYRGLMTGLGRWIMVRGNFAETEFLFRRVKHGNRTDRIVHVDFDRARMSRIMGEAEFLATLPPEDR